MIDAEPLELEPQARRRRNLERQRDELQAQARQSWANDAIRDELEAIQDLLAEPDPGQPFWFE